MTKIPQHVNDCPDDKYLNKYVRGKVCAAGANKWRDLGIVLMGQDAVTVLDVIRINHPNDVEECCSRMFTKWRQRTPKTSWKQLIGALKEVKLTQLASELEEGLHFKGLKRSHMYGNIDAISSPRLRQSGILKTKPEMKDLIIIVIPLLKGEWEDVAFLLNYKATTINGIKQSYHDDPRKCCRALFMDWLETNHSVSPKDWDTLLNTIAESEDFTKTVEDILKQLEKKFIGYYD